MANHGVPYLTTRQEQIVQCIRESIADRGEAPTVREIGHRIGYRSEASVHYQLAQIERKGAIVREAGRTRGIRLT